MLLGAGTRADTRASQQRYMTKQFIQNGVQMQVEMIIYPHKNKINYI